MRLAALLLAAAALAAPVAAQATDTLAAHVEISRARLAVAEGQIRATTVWRRLLPRASVYASASTRGLVFAPVSSQGYDPLQAALARWPGDAYGLSIRWSLDQLLDRTTRRKARQDLRIARAQVALAEARRRDALAAQEHLALEAQLLAAVRDDYEAGAATFAQLLQRRLAHLNARRSLARLDADLQAAALVTSR